MKYLAILLFLWVSLPALAQNLEGTTVTTKTYPGGTTVTNVEAPGNLAKTQELDCITLEQIKNEYTPPDLYGAFGKCINAGKYKEAVDLNIMAGLFSRYDTLRVTDQTSHQAVIVLNMNAGAGLTQEQQNKYKEAAGAVILKKDQEKPQSPAYICDAAKKLDAPNYYPSYMIQHGMGAFTGNVSRPIVENFDPKEGWKTAIDQYLHCPL